MEALAYLPDVAEEHLEEASYALRRFDAELESATLGLAELAHGLEPRLLAHVDALVVAKQPVQRELLASALMEADETDPSRATVAAWALLEAGAFASVLSATIAAPAAGSCVARAGQLTLDTTAQAWLRAQLAHGMDRAWLLEIAAHRRVPPPNLLEPLQHTDPALVRAAARCVRHGLDARYTHVLADLLSHTDGETRAAALVAGLCLGLSQAWSACEAWALSEEQPCPLATQLYAALGARGHHARLERLRANPGARDSVLFALGFSGNAALVPVLLEHLESPDRRESKLALQSLGLIVGFSPADERWAAKEPSTLGHDQDAALPSLEADDLDAELVPTPEDSLPHPDVAAVRAHCSAAQLTTSERLVWGAPMRPEQLSRVLRDAPLRVRHTLSIAASIRSSGALWVDTRTLSVEQHRQLAAISNTQFTRYLAW